MSRGIAEWHTTSFGGSVTVQDEPESYTWHSSSFGGSVTVEGEPTWSNWSSSWKIGQTSVYDIATPLDMEVDYLDASDLTIHYGESGANGWIYADIDDNGVVNYLDASGLTLHYGEDYTT